MKKITCRECVRTCCDEMRIDRTDKTKGVNPDELKVGSLLVVQGVIWKKLKSGFWGCIAFDAKKRLCKIWKYRPHLCRFWVCGFAKKSRRKLISNSDDVFELQSKDNYSIHFSVNSQDLMKIPERKGVIKHVKYCE